MSIDLIGGFVRELREAGVPVSMVEALDAMQALRHTDIGDREQFKSALGATLVKNQRHYEVFDTAFEVYFALRSPPEAIDSTAVHPGGDGQGQSGSGGPAELDELTLALLAAIRTGDAGAVRAIARRAVDRLSGFEPGRPVGGTYYVYRTLRQLDVEAILAELLGEDPAQYEPGDFRQRLLREEYESRLSEFRREVEAEVRRRLVADRGADAVARALRRPLLEDVDLMHASRVELGQLERAVHPLTRKLAARLARRRRPGSVGRLDFRRTIRGSLSTGGVPIDPRYRRPHPSKPEVFLICDISGSMSTFARFTLQFVYAMSNQFSRLRSFAFIDALDEVTTAFRPGGDFAGALRTISTTAEVVWLDGHSDYGHALEGFREQYAGDLSSRSTVIVTGDARNNYRPPREDIVAEIGDRSRGLYWLNPEPVAYWDTGDSVISRYGRHCDGVFEVRNLRQLEGFVEKLASAPAGLRGSLRSGVGW